MLPKITSLWYLTNYSGNATLLLVLFFKFYFILILVVSKLVMIYIKCDGEAVAVDEMYVLFVDTPK